MGIFTLRKGKLMETARFNDELVGVDQYDHLKHSKKLVCSICGASVYHRIDGQNATYVHKTHAAEQKCKESGGSSAPSVSLVQTPIATNMPVKEASLVEVYLDELYVPLINFYSGKSFRRSNINYLYHNRIDEVMSGLDAACKNKTHINGHGVMCEDGLYTLVNLEDPLSEDMLAVINLLNFGGISSGVRIRSADPIVFTDATIRNVYGARTNKIIKSVRSVVSNEIDVMGYRLSCERMKGGKEKFSFLPAEMHFVCDKPAPDWVTIDEIDTSIVKINPLGKLIGNARKQPSIIAVEEDNTKAASKVVVEASPPPPPSLPQVKHDSLTDSASASTSSKKPIYGKPTDAAQDSTSLATAFESFEKVSLFESARHSVSKHTVGIDWIVSQIQSGRWKAKVDAYRSTYERDPKRAGGMKAGLPAFTQSIELTTEEKVRSDVADGGFVHTGLIQVDIDDLTKSKFNSPEELGRAFMNDPHFRFGYISPSLKYKAFCKVTPVSTIEEHAHAFLTVARYCAEHFGMMDEGISDVSRLCFISHDPAAWIKPAVPLQWVAEKKTPARPASRPAGSGNKKRRGDYIRFKNSDWTVVDFIKKHGIHVHWEETNIVYGEIVTQYKVDCPFHLGHTTPTEKREAHVYQLASGVKRYKCWHGSCEHNKWQEFRKVFEPDFDKKTTPNRKKKGRNNNPTPANRSKLYDTRSKECIKHEAEIVRRAMDQPVEPAKGLTPRSVVKKRASFEKR